MIVWMKAAGGYFIENKKNAPLKNQEADLRKDRS
jgi:hypothetical protein